MGFMPKYFKGLMSQSPESSSGLVHSARSSMSVDNARRSSASGSDSASSSSRHMSSVQQEFPLDNARKVSEVESMSPRRETSAWSSLSGRLESTIGTIMAKLSLSKRLSGRLSDGERTSSRYFGGLFDVERTSSRNFGRNVSRSNSPKSVLDSGKYGLSEDEELAVAFNIIDANGDGKISATELRSVLHSIGFEVSEEEFHQMMQAVDTDGDGEIDLNEFIHHNTIPPDFTESSTARSGELRAAFHVFDLDKNDFISADELFSVFKSLGQLTTMAECARMIRAVDSDGDGQVNFEEFEKMMFGVCH